VILGMHTVEEVEDMPVERWQGTAQPTVTAEIVDPFRDEFEAMLSAASWSDKQRRSLRSRYAGATASERADLCAEMHAHLNPQEQPTEVSE
jgi:hypothetical protein